MMNQQHGYTFQTKEYKLLDPNNVQVPSKTDSNIPNFTFYNRNRPVVHLRPMVAPKMLDVYSFETKSTSQKPVKQIIPLKVEKRPEESERPAYPITSISYHQKAQYHRNNRIKVNPVKQREQSHSSNSKIKPSKFNSNEGIEKYVMKFSKVSKIDNDQNFRLRKQILKIEKIEQQTDFGNNSYVHELSRTQKETIRAESCEPTFKESSVGLLDSEIHNNKNRHTENHHKHLRNSFAQLDETHTANGHPKNQIVLGPIRAPHHNHSANRTKVSEKRPDSPVSQILNFKGPKDLFVKGTTSQTQTINEQELKSSSQASKCDLNQADLLEIEKARKFNILSQLTDETIDIEEERSQKCEIRGRVQSENDIFNQTDNLLRQQSPEKSGLSPTRHSLLDSNSRRYENDENNKLNVEACENNHNVRQSSSLSSRIHASQSKNKRNSSRFSPELPSSRINAQHKRSIRSLEEKRKIETLKKKLTESITPGILEKSVAKVSSNGSDLFKNDKFQDLTLTEDDFPENLSVNIEEEEDLDESLVTSRVTQKKAMLLNSVYSGRPRTIFFQYHRCCEKTRDTSRAIYLQPDEEKLYDLKFKSITIGCILRTFTNAGFKRLENNNSSNWYAYWGKPRYNLIKEMNRYQKTNHFPGCWNLGRKDSLWRNISRMKRAFPAEYNFIPNTYILSSDYQRFIAARETAENKSLWIMKPCASACGRGIKLVSKKTKIKKNINFLVSEYISNPHLINGLKYDLRLYVLVSCYDPLRIYLHKEGLVRFATKAYTTNVKSVKERFVHLTNWSVNKKSEKFVKNTNTHKDDEGSKWSFPALRRKYQEMGIDTEELWKKIKDIIIKTIISAEPYMLGGLNRTAEHRNNCYELYGFDVLIDSNLKPWLMEVNVCPSLNSSSPLDKKIKTSVICDMMNLLGFVPYDKKKFDEEKKAKSSTAEGKKYQSKNVNEINELNEQNCLELMSPEDWNVLFEADEEWYRKGDFERIFPERDNIDSYAKFFEFPRYNNAIVWRWLKCNENFLEKICQKVASLSV